MADIISNTSGNDTLIGGGNDTIIGGGGNDTYFVSPGDFTITDFGGIGQGTSPTAAVIAEVDTLRVEDPNFTARNMLLTQNGSNLEITFERDNRSSSYFFTKVTLQNFALENLDNLSTSTGATVDLGNIVFYGQTSATDSFDVFNANSTQSTIFNKNTVTFLNDLNNTVDGFDDSDDVINGQGGDDIIDGKSGNDLLRGGSGDNLLIGGVGNDTLSVDSSTGDNTLNGGTGNDTLNANYSAGNNLLCGGDGNDSLIASFALTRDAMPNNFYDPDDFLNSSGNNSLNGGAGNDALDANYSTGNNFLSGGDGNDYISASGYYISFRGNFNLYDPISGNNTLNGDAGDDTLNSNYSTGDNTLNGGAGDDILDAEISTGNKLLSGGDGDDSLSVSGYLTSNPYTQRVDPSSGDNTLNGGAGNDTLRAEYSTGNNLLSGDDGNDSLSISAYYLFLGDNDDPLSASFPSSGNNTLNGGTGDDTLNASGSTGNNFLFGGDGNDFFYLSPASPDTAPASLVTQTVDGGNDDDLLFLDYRLATEGITTTFNSTTNIGSITAGTYLVNYKNIEQFNISGTAYNDNIVGSNGNDTLSTGDGGNDTIDGGEGDDLLSVDYSNATGGITTTFNTITNIGSITAGTNLVTYKNIEQLNIFGSAYDDNIVGSNGNNILSTGDGGNDTIDGGEGDDLLFVDYSNVTEGITSTFNTTTNIGSITAGTNLVNYKNIEQLNISGTAYNDNIVGSNGNDTLSGYSGNDTIFGGVGNDILVGGADNDTLTGGVGNDQFVFEFYNYGTDIITDLSGVEKGSNASEAVIASLDTLQFTGGGLTAENLQLTQNGNNLEITFQIPNFGIDTSNKVILENFKLENLDNLPATSSQPAIGNILFDGETSITDSFDVFDADSTQTNLFNKNTVTFLNDLDNSITGFDNSNDVINGQGGDDIIDGLSGDDLLRGGTGNDLLIGGVGNDTLISSAGNDTLDGGTGDDTLIVNSSIGDNLLSGGDGNDSLGVSADSNDSRSSGNNTLNGGAGDDRLNANRTTGNNLLSGGDGNDYLDVSNNVPYAYPSGSSGNNTLNGGAGDDTLSAGGSTGDNLLLGGDGNDYFDISGSSYSSTIGKNTLNGGAGNDRFDAGDSTGNTLFFGDDGNDYLDINGGNFDDRSSGNNTLNGGADDDTLSAGGSTGDNLLLGGDGNDYLDISGSSYSDFYDNRSTGNNTLNGGAGDDIFDLSGSAGDNLIFGGDGTDTFIFANYDEGINTIDDFNATNELIQLGSYFDYGLSIGTLETSQFTIGASATTSEERFIYNSATGALFFDQDGSASGFTQRQFAQLSTGLSLTNNNFVVV
ncbi:calcium-binding protein [Nostoc sp. UHCC 0252]|nr:calcium-binding protein [Nostoc sp. UHCC 0252]MEA5606109.1 calcium-binding protein [Nostoc sp. UHCC 0252]